MFILKNICVFAIANVYIMTIAEILFLLAHAVFYVLSGKSSLSVRINKSNLIKHISLLSSWMQLFEIVLTYLLTKNLERLSHV